ncbi:MAG: hypothetical protein HY290_27450 [Planctomycetia bacterium]|nr:hypothetical protein [Planctomycetia bacterium]
MPDISIRHLPFLGAAFVEPADATTAVEADDEVENAVTVEVPGGHVVHTRHSAARPDDAPRAIEEGRILPSAPAPIEKFPYAVAFNVDKLHETR